MPVDPPDQVLDPTWLPIMPAAPRPGVLVLAADTAPLATRAGVDTVAMLREKRQQVLFIATANAVPLAQTVRRNNGVLGVVLHPAGAIDLGAKLALVFAEHLGTGRPRPAADDHRLRVVGPFVTSAKADSFLAVAGVVRLPHLVTVRTRDGHADTVVWEWLAVPDAEALYGGPLPDLSALHAHVRELLALRAAVRAQQLPDTPGHRELGRVLLTAPFSLQLVLTHYELICRLIAAARKESRR